MTANPSIQTEGQLDLGNATVSYVMHEGDVVLSYAEVVVLPRGDSLGALFATHPSVRGDLDCKVCPSPRGARLGLTLQSFRELLVRVRRWAIERDNGHRHIARWAAGVLDTLNQNPDHQADEAMRGRR